MSFEDIQIGDLVIIKCQGKEYARRVSSMTKTLFTVAGIRFRKKDGVKFGSGAFPTIFARKVRKKSLER